MKKKNGFTLIELMVILAVIAIVAAFGMPKLSGIIQRNRIISDANILTVTLGYARSEAVKRGRPVNVSAVDDTVNWSGGYRVYIDAPPTDGLFAADEKKLREVNKTNTPNLNISAASANDIIFEADGTMRATSGQPIVITESGNNIFTLTISEIGHITLSKE